MRTLFTLILCIFVYSGAVQAQSMSDEQIIQYVQQAQLSGKSQQQMATELAAKGVTPEQMQRLKDKYEKSQASTATKQKTTGTNRTREKQPQEKKPVTGQLTNEVYDDLQFAITDSMVLDSIDKSKRKPKVFGRDIFNNKNLTFEPNVNIATPANYQLGPGDQVIIDIWGAYQNTYTETISPDGNINISNLGPVYLNGLTVAEANSYIQQKFRSIYSGVTDQSTSSIKLTLGQIRTIQVNIMGEVAVPGTYALSSFASVFHALYNAGGVSDIGSLRHIQVMRAGKLKAELDIYDYLMNGKFSNDIRLMDGDVIIVTPYDCMVTVTGNVKRPLIYEMKNTETVANLLTYAGGFTGDAYTKSIRLIRKSGRERQIFNVETAQFANFRVTDGDSLSVNQILDRFENRVEIKGAVYREGLYQLSDEVNSVKKLIDKAEGIMGDAFLNRAEITRMHEDLTLEIIPVDLKGILKGSTADIPLQKNDVLYIPSIHDLKEAGVLTIHGEVALPGVYPYAKNASIEDIIVQAGGLLESASTIRVDVARRIKDPKSQRVGSEVGETFSFSLKDGFVVDGTPGFILEPFDEIYVRRSPGYQEQSNVSVIGEVVFGGTHALSIKNERLSDLVRKAGGLTKEAYPAGARLIRKMNEEETARLERTLKMAKKNATEKDSIKIESLETDTNYPVGIQLEKALANPGSDYDLVLREGDKLLVPQYINTVKINGEVMYPNTVVFQKGKKLKHYINQAGGFGQKARKSKVFVVYMNGTVAEVSGNSSKAIQPGCEIVVPAKPDKRGMSTAEVISLGTSIASLGAIIASMITLFK